MSRRVRIDLIMEAMNSLGNALRESGVGRGQSSISLPKHVAGELRTYVASMYVTTNEMRDLESFHLFGIWIEEAKP